MTIILSLLGMAGAFAMIKYRAQLGDIVGEAEWMRKVGGVHNLIIICAMLLFFWCVATLTGTQYILLSPLLWLIPRPGGGV